MNEKKETVFIVYDRFKKRFGITTDVLDPHFVIITESGVDVRGYFPAWIPVREVCNTDVKKVFADIQTFNECYKSNGLKEWAKILESSIRNYLKETMFMMLAVR